MLVYGLWINLNDGVLEPLLNEAKELEKKYEWLQAAEYYRKALDLEIDEKNILKAAELQEKIGYCYYRASFQAQSNTEFQKLMKIAVKSYEKELEILAIKEKENRIRINHNDLIEFSQYALFSILNYSEWVRKGKEILSLAEKTIQSLSKSRDDNELARAYCLVSILYNMFYEVHKLGDTRNQLFQRWQDYSKKALDLSSRTGDAWLIGNSYYAVLKIAIYNGNFELATEYGEKIIKYGRVTKDNRLLNIGNARITLAMMIAIEFLEDPDKQREICDKVRKFAQENIRVAKIIDHMDGIYTGYFSEIWALVWLAIVEINPQKKKTIIMKIIEMCRKVLELLKEWKRFSGFFYGFLSSGLFMLAETKSEVEEKKSMLIEAQHYQRKYLAHLKEFFPFQCPSWQYYNLAVQQIELANIQSDKSEKIKLLKQAVLTLDKSDELLAEYLKFHPDSETIFTIKVYGKHNDRRGKILQQIYYLTKERENLSEAIEAHNKAALFFTKTELPAHAAESYWNIAQLQAQKGEHQEASQNYESASNEYNQAAKKTPQLKDFYNDYSSYMQAWSQIEQAKYSHSIEEYNKAKEHYKKSAELHESTEQWNYLAPNYFAWANMEEAEGFSRRENTQQAKHAFQEALQQFSIAEDSMKQRHEEITSSDEKAMVQRLLKVSELRYKYCEARILMEDAKLLDRKGKYLQSSRSYRQASNNIEKIIEEIDNETERKELELLTILCQAWEKMANAEEATSSRSYLDAAELFEKAKELCYTKKASLWTLANSNFCKGLAAGIRYQENMDLKENAMAKQYIKSSASNYLQAGFKNASEYAKATQRLFDAYTFMNQAENEIDPEKKTKQYQMAENLLQIAAGSFIKAKQPEKTDQVQQILRTVREEKALAVSLTEVMHAPSVTSSTFSFTAPTATSEASVGLESFEHANVQANLIVSVKEVRIGESFSLSVEVVNAGREPALLMRVDNFVPSNFVVVKKPEIYRLEDTTLNMKGKQLAALKLVEVKLTLQPLRKGQYQFSPRVLYLDERGQSRMLQLKTLEIKVEEVILEDRVSTGTEELDSLLLGGVPKEYAVALSGSPCDEREMIVKNFLRAGVEEGISFYVTTEVKKMGNLLENPNFFLFLCNPKPKVEVPDLPNVYKLQGITDLTNLGIALTKAYRNINQNLKQPKRICVETLSEVLVNVGEKTTRKWISGLITNLGTKGFVMLAVMDPKEHPLDIATTIINLFDGEINIIQSDDRLECKKSILVKKLRNQDYIKNPICLR